MNSTTVTTNAISPASGKSRRIIQQALSVLVALAFLLAGGSKLYGAGQMVEMFARIGFGQWLRYLTGTLEVIGAIGLFIPRHAFYAAVLLAAIMLGAVITHLAVIGGSPAPPIVLLLLCGTIAYLRKPDHH